MNYLGKKQFYTERNSYRYERKFNPKKYSMYFWDKSKFNITFYNYIKRDWLLTRGKTEDEVISFLKNHSKVVVKPIALSSGKGIYIIETENQFDVINYAKDFTQKEVLLEEFIIQHKKLAELNPTSVNSVRIYTVLDEKEMVYIISAALRVGGKEAVVDNFHSGGICYSIDIETGICGLGYDMMGNEYRIHPSTNLKVIGLEIPNWGKLKEFIYKVAKVLPKSRLIAWDVAILEDGFELIEGNYEGDPGIMQTPSKLGKAYFIKSKY